MEVGALPDNGLCRPPEAINYWQILNAIERSMADQGERDNERAEITDVQRGTNPMASSICVCVGGGGVHCGAETVICCKTQGPFKVSMSSWIRMEKTTIDISFHFSMSVDACANRI